MKIDDLVRVKGDKSPDPQGKIQPGDVFRITSIKTWIWANVRGGGEFLVAYGHPFAPDGVLEEDLEVLSK